MESNYFGIITSTTSWIDWQRWLCIALRSIGLDLFSFCSVLDIRLEQRSRALNKPQNLDEVNGKLLYLFLVI